MQYVEKAKSLFEADLSAPQQSGSLCWGYIHIVGRGLAPAVMNDFVLSNGGTKAPPYKWYGLYPMCLCNTKAKPAI